MQTSRCLSEEQLVVGTFAGLGGAFHCSVVTNATGITRLWLVNHQDNQPFAMMAFWCRSNTLEVVSNL
jgi:hypothetical protein